MIRIVVIRNEQHQILGCSIDGHAGFAEHGYDIVCAAVSALSCTAMLGLAQVAKQEGTYENASGRCEITLSGEITQESQAILETMVLGLSEISKQYSNLVNISDK